jgi:hypothetical protein
MQESIDHLANRNPSYFADNLPSNQHWRLYRNFQDTSAFLDIETTGLHGGEITTIVLYDGRSIRYYVNGDNLDEFPHDVNDYRLLVTYNGKSFDVPFIEGYFHVQLSQAHIDLRYVLRDLGLKGGLKGCERQLGLSRVELEGIDGSVAPLLWHEYRKDRNARALETLLAYNIQDTLSLHALMVHAYNQKVWATPFSGSHSLPPPSLPEPPFKADHETVERVRRLAFGWGPFSQFPLRFRREESIHSREKTGDREGLPSRQAGTSSSLPPSAAARASQNAD